MSEALLLPELGGYYDSIRDDGIRVHQCNAGRGI
jgi:hypothetical protein